MCMNSMAGLTSALAKKFICLLSSSHEKRIAEAETSNRTIKDFVFFLPTPISP